MTDNQKRTNQNDLLDAYSQAVDRKSVVQGKSVDLGGRRIIKKKKKRKKKKKKEQGACHQ